MAITIDGTGSISGVSSTGISAAQTVDASSITAGTLAVANGGTGASTLTANNVILGNGISAPLFVAPGANGNVLTSNGTTWTSLASAGGGGSLINVQVFATAGTYTYTKTAGTNKIYAICIGGGGGGQSYTSTGASSGGAGGCAVKFISSASSITTATLRVGTGGGQSTAGQSSYIDFSSIYISGSGGGGADSGGYNYGGAVRQDQILPLMVEMVVACM